MSAKAGAPVPRAPRAMARNPLSVDEILTGFYRPDRSVPEADADAGGPEADAESCEAGAAVHAEAPGHAPAPPASPTSPASGDPAADELAAKKARPTHYKIVCISLYTEDIERLDSLVRQLKRRGHTKANKSQVIREALLQIDLDKVPRSH